MRSPGPLSPRQHRSVVTFGVYLGQTRSQVPVRLGAFSHLAAKEQFESSAPLSIGHSVRAKRFGNIVYRKLPITLAPNERGGLVEAMGLI